MILLRKLLVEAFGAFARLIHFRQKGIENEKYCNVFSSFKRSETFGIYKVFLYIS